MITTKGSQHCRADSFYFRELSLPSDQQRSEEDSVKQDNSLLPFAFDKQTMYGLTDCLSGRSFYCLSLNSLNVMLY